MRKKAPSLDDQTFSCSIGWRETRRTRLDPHHRELGAGRPRCHGVLLCFGLGGSPRTVHPQIKMAAWCRTLFTRVPAHVTFRSSWVDEAMEIRLVLPLERNIMASK